MGVYKKVSEGGSWEGKGRVVYEGKVNSEKGVEGLI